MIQTARACNPKQIAATLVDALTTLPANYVPYSVHLSTMPELPEVETTRRAIAPLISGQRLERLLVYESRMRWPIPRELPAQVRGQRVLACTRRGKYLLIQFEHGTQIVHLGMSGSLRSAPAAEQRRTHDHVEWHFPRARLLLHDPRRFGAVLWQPASAGCVLQHPLLAHLGIEPFDPAFDAQHLERCWRDKQQAVKLALLSGKAVVGVGNIYACEALFRAQIHPATPAGTLSLARCARLADAIKHTLTQALESGGSTLRDYVQVSGEHGTYFALHAAVYNRENQPCPRCYGTVHRMVQGQRSTYWCPRCQRR